LISLTTCAVNDFIGLFLQYKANPLESFFLRHGKNGDGLQGRMDRN
jgi:hypothetical protein